MLRKVLLGSVAVTLATLSMSAESDAQQKQQRVTVVAPQTAVQARQTVNLPLNKSQVLHVSEPVSRIAVGNADIADAQPLSDQQFYVLGKSVGTTNLSVYGQDSRLLAVVDVVVGIDVEAAKAAIHSLLPGEKIEVRAVNDAIALSGVVNSPGKLAQAVEIAKRFVASGKNEAAGANDHRVINDLRVKGTQQVMLQVKVAEMQRNVTKQLGFLPAFNIRNPSGGNQPFPISQSGSGLSTPTSNAAGFASVTDLSSTLTSFLVAAGTAVSGSFAFNATIDALEQKGAVKVLAEPNLIAMSGDTASFLAGGEFPVPTNETSSAGVPTISVTFKPFGVSLAFTPTVVGDDLINLVVAPEVSQIDKTTAPVVINGFLIPGISTRRAKTTVEVRDGQSFAIAGLLQSDFFDQVNQIPGLGDIPVLGALARDSQFKRNEVELVIVITPRLVHPAPAGTLKAPTDSFVVPSEADIFLNGKVEGPALLSVGGGLSGQYGHIVR
jgi:pilus assembly protein CpaC